MTIRSKPCDRPNKRKVGTANGCGFSSLGRTQPQLRVLDLFSGIGAFSLGLDRTGGFRTVAFAEIEPYPSSVLIKNNPSAPNLGDVRKISFSSIGADVIVAGFPCQDISNAGKRAGISGDRSGLWREVARAISEIRPKYAILENVGALRYKGRGLQRVLGDLASVGYDAVWHCIPASYVGAPHNRDRIWITAAPHAIGGERWAKPYCRALGRMGREQQSVPWDRDWQSALREFRGVDDGTAYRVDRIDTLRNAVVPQIPELIGNAILEVEKQLNSARHPL